MSYATEVKRRLLGVTDELVDVRRGLGAVRPAMAEGVRTLPGATGRSSTTGVAGPDRQEGKPAGTVHVGLAGPRSVERPSWTSPATGREIQDRTCARPLGGAAGCSQRSEPRCWVREDYPNR